MIVIAVIGLLASVALASYNGYREQAACKNMASDARNVASAALAYCMKNGTWDISLSDIQDVFHPSSIGATETTVNFGLTPEGDGSIEVSHPDCSVPYTFCQSKGAVVQGSNCGG